MMAGHNCSWKTGIWKKKGDKERKKKGQRPIGSTVNWWCASKSLVQQPHNKRNIQLWGEWNTYSWFVKSLSLVARFFGGVGLDRREIQIQHSTYKENGMKQNCRWWQQPTPTTLKILHPINTNSFTLHTVGKFLFQIHTEDAMPHRFFWNQRKWKRSYR